MKEDNNDLSNKNVQPVFYYSREKRISHAPEAVQNAWEKGYTPQKGFIRGLTANAGLKSIFFVIVLLSLAIFFVSLFGQPEGMASVQGLDFKIKSFLYDETIFITLTMTSKNVQDGPIPVIAILNGLDSSGEKVTQALLEGVFNGSELLLRTTMRDFEIKKINASINVKKTMLEIQVSVDRT
ncbi:MAG TPA: hypothetical protein VJ861_01545 [Treponemataceae bacterium]|nr:hypothetical protein [Treponemataceae bacterium]